MVKYYQRYDTEITEVFMEIFRLWNEDDAGRIGEGGAPQLCYYPARKKTTSAAVLIFAGGGYSHRSRHEGEGYARKLNSWGMDAFVLDYRVAPCRFPLPLLDARRAMRFIRSNAQRFGVDGGRIAVMGSSAGGHLAALLSTYKNAIEGEGTDETDGEDFIPNMQILCYPVIDIEGHRGSFENLLGEDIERHAELTPTQHIDGGTPRAFIWHTATDPIVDVNNTLRYAERLHECGIPFELHVYPIGTHGAGLAVESDDPERIIPYVQGWIEELKKYFILNGFLEN